MNQREKRGELLLLERVKVIRKSKSETLPLSRGAKRLIKTIELSHQGQRFLTAEYGQ